MMTLVVMALMTMLAAGAYLWIAFAQMLRYAFGGRYRLAALALGGAAVIGMIVTRAAWGLFIYLVLFCAIADIIGKIAVALSRRQNNGSKDVATTAWGGAIGIVLAVVLSVYGYFVAKDIRTTHYDITIAKSAGEIQTLRAVLMTDMHIGTMIGKAELDAIALRVNALSPDIIFFGGDIYDDKTSPELIEHSLEAWRSLTAPYGVYFVSGNHERAHYGGAHIAEALPRLHEAGVTLLEDEVTLVGDSFYVVGRKDAAIRGRMNPSQLTNTTDKRKPIILLDHQPTGIAAVAKAGVDLMLSGHTHAGQIWPFGYLIKPLSPNEVLYGHFNGVGVRSGHLRNKCTNLTPTPPYDGSLQVIVSSGAGTWGFPMRVGTRSEIVVLDIAFTEE